MLAYGAAANAMQTSQPTAVVAKAAAEKTASLDINMNNGTFTTISESKKYAAHWRSKQTNPTIDIDCGKNNIDIAQSDGTRIQAWIGRDGSCAYNISVSEGWKIVGYSMDAALVTEGNAVTLRDANNKEYVLTTTPTTITVNNINARTTLFTLVGGNYGANLTNFKVIYAADDSGTKTDLRTFTVFDTHNSTVPYRIPAIGKAYNGDIIAVADYRYSKGDIGTGKLDLRLRRSTDNGASWGDVLTPEMFKGDGKNANGTDFVRGTSVATQGRHDACAYGDPCIVGDRTSPRMMITSCSGYPGFGEGDNTYHQGWARWYSDDNGANWKGPEYLDEKFVYEPLRKAGHYIHGFFIGSGKIHQSRYIKKDKYYRLYCAGLSQTSGSKANWVLYSDDFGETWAFLGGTKTSPLAGGDEPKVEELPNGNVILSSRTPYGRYFNIYTYSEPLDGESGSWGTMALSNSAVNGLVSSESFGTNGEIQIMPVTRKSDGTKTFIALQSLPTGANRTNVKIFYKEIGSADKYDTPADFAKDWDGSYQVSTTTSAYSTWCLQGDNALGLLYEENNYNSGYDIVYKHLTVETVTADKYSFNADYKYEDKNVDFGLAANNRQLDELINTVETAVKANSSYTEGEKLVTSASQLKCPWGCKEQKPANATDQNWQYDIYDIDNLIDRNADTYYHTVWQNGNVAPGTHYLDVTANDMFSGIIKIDVTRRKANDDHITEFTISGSNDDCKTLDKVAVVGLDNAVSGAETSNYFTIPGGAEYKTLRFNVTATNSGRGYWHMAEFQLFPLTLDKDCNNAKAAEAYAEVEKALEAANAKKGNATEDDIAALQNAYDKYTKAINDITTGIGNIKAETNKSDKVYDLQGRRVYNMQKGVYIVNGKKIIR